MTTIAVDARSSLQQTLAWVIATFAVAGGLIHLEAGIEHLDLTIVAIGFAAMAISQMVLAGITVAGPTRAALFGVGALHAAIALVWIISRTIGLPFVPGAEHAVQVGVADVVANTFSIAVVGVAIVALALDRYHRTLPLHPTTARIVKGVALVGALILTVAALSETHDHGDSESSGQATSHSHDHAATP